MQEKIQQKNLIHKKVLFILWTVGLVLGLAVGCGKNNDNKVNLVPKIDTEEKKTARIHFIDTGNSDAILIEQGVVYTNNGERYHMDQMCSNMKEPIAVTMDEVGERTPCKKCCY